MSSAWTVAGPGLCFLRGCVLHPSSTSVQEMAAAQKAVGGRSGRPLSRTSERGLLHGELSRAAGRRSRPELERTCCEVWAWGARGAWWVGVAERRRQGRPSPPGLYCMWTPNCSSRVFSLQKWGLVVLLLLDRSCAWKHLVHAAWSRGRLALPWPPEKSRERRRVPTPAAQPPSVFSTQTQSP